MARNTPERDERDALPADLQALHQQLQADSATWHQHTPSSERLIARYQTLLTQQMDDGMHDSRDRFHSLHPALHAERGYMTTRQKRLGGIFAAVMVAALLVAAIAIFQHHPSKPGTNGATTPTQAPTATQAPALHVTASQGWVFPAAIAFGKSIAFAHSAPLTGYVCGNMLPVSSEGKNAPLRFSVTLDGGATWRELGVTPAQGISCQMSIDPANAGDIVLSSTAYTGAIATYRSLDGGSTWSPLQAPAGDSATVNLTEVDWAGSTLFATATQASGTDSSIYLAHTLAVSSNGGPLTWVDISHLPRPTDPHVLQSLRGGFAIGTTFYAYLWDSTAACYGPIPITNCPTIPPSIVKTSDNGATWTTYPAPSPAAGQTYLARTMADGHTLLGTKFPGGPALGSYLSTDVAQTWSALPALPRPAQGESGGGIGPSAPDGTIYALYYHGNTPFALLKLSPGAASWTTVADTIPGPIDSANPAVSVDGAGHPNAVWSDNNGNPGIAYHAP